MERLQTSATLLNRAHKPYAKSPSGMIPKRMLDASPADKPYYHGNQE